MSSKEKQVVVHGKTFEVFITNEGIQQRLKKICTKINKDFQGKRPVFIGVLNGVFRMFADVMQYIELDCEISFVKLKSYVGEKSGDLKMMMGLDIDLKDRPVILLEDIVDTGKTLYHFLPELKSHQPTSITICSLLVKPDAAEYEVPLDYVGFAVPNHFLIGYGLDYDGLGRELNDIYQAV